MTGEWITLTADDGHHFKAYKVAAESLRRGGLVVAMEIFGVNAHIRAVAEDFAAQGFDVVAPQLYDRVEQDVDNPYTAAGIEKGRAIRTRITWNDTLRDLSASRIALAETGPDGTYGIGIIGYCYGGTLAWLAAAKLDGYAAAVSYYGIGLMSFADLSPNCPTLIHFGSKDKSTPLDKIEDLASTHPDVAIHLYDADHGFNCDHRATYDPAAADLARERSLAFFKDNLG